MFRAFSLAIDQLGDPSSRRIVLRTLLLTAVLYGLLAAGVWYGFAYLPKTQTGWINSVVDFLAGAGVAVVLAFLFPAISSGFISLFLDDVAEAVERRHYPNDPAGRPAPFWPSLWGSLRFMLVMIGLNLAAIPIYILMIWIPFLNFFIIYCLNGYLLSREYFELVAGRHVDGETVRRMRLANRGRLWLAGAGFACLFSIPVVGLLAPILATATTVHLFKAMRNDKDSHDVRT